MLIEKLRQKKNFTETEQNIAEIILNYGEQLSTISIRSLAEKAFVSTASIQRMCQKLGCDGYRDFKFRYLKELSSHTEDILQVDASHPFHFGAQPSVIARNLSALSAKALRSCNEIMNYDDLNKAADLIRSHDIILGFGIGDSQITMEGFLNRLQKLQKYCINASRKREDVVIAMNATRASTAVFVSYHGGNLDMKRSAKILQDRGVPYIVLSSVPTELTEHASVWLRIPTSEIVADNIATFYSQECFSYFLNIIYSIVYARNYEKNHEHKKQVDQLISDSNQHN